MPRRLIGTLRTSTLLAMYRLEQRTITNLSASQRAVAAFVEKTGKTCPDILRGAPRGYQLNELLLEMYLAVALVADEPDQHADMVFVRLVAGLRWSNHRVTDFVDDVTREMTNEIHAVVPNLCSDFRSWVESDHRMLPLTTKLFLRKMRASEPKVKGVGNSESAEDVVGRLLVPYERRDAKKLVGRIEMLERSFRGPAEEIIFGANATLSSVIGVAS